MTGLRVMTAADVAGALAELGDATVPLIRGTYEKLATGLVIEAPHSFLRVSSAPAVRGIALPAAIADAPLFGLKWICGAPANVDRGLPRASGVLVLSEGDTGRPVALLPAAEISTLRTAASAVVAAEAAGLTGLSSCTIVGAGVLAQTLVRLLARTSTLSGAAGVTVHDVRPARAAELVAYARDLGLDARVRDAGRIPPETELLILSTSAVEPHLAIDGELATKMVLNLSLRDVPPMRLRGMTHWTDSRTLALSEGTSLAVAVADGVVSTAEIHELGEVLIGRDGPAPQDPPICFSPFGLGALDLALGLAVYERCTARADGIVIAKFEKEGTDDGANYYGQDDVPSGESHLSEGPR